VRLGKQMYDEVKMQKETIKELERQLHDLKNR
jgi:polyhydroxyalkanoate synthesis regulator phasin